MSYTAIADVGETLIHLLRNNMAGMPGYEDQNIQLSSPADAKDYVRLTLFLYAVVENRELENDVMQAVSQTRLNYPPMTVDLYYLLTAHGPINPNLTNRAIVAHKFLGMAMRIFYDNGILSGSVLRGNLREREDPDLHLTKNQLSMDEINKIWEIFPETPYKESVSYLVTPVKIYSEREVDVQRVVRKQVDVDFIDK
jgi:hypothetical protein